MIPINMSLDNRRFGVGGITLSAHQPEFMPWLGYISKVTMGDVYFILDTVQYVKDVFQNRNKIRIKQGKGWQWLNIPVKDAGSHILNWKDIKIDNSQNWKRKHLNAMFYSYSKTPYFDWLFNDIEKLYLKDEEFLLDFIIKISKLVLNKFEVNVPLYRTSELIELGYDINGNKSELIVNMCKVVNADNFIFGSMGRIYIDKEIFKDNNINLLFQNFKHPVYKQIHGDFIPNMSSIDLLFNHGKEESIRILGKSMGDSE
tara:strand:- start:169 stop:942 length:774 start_codon:yes stop_codon:yes gene_type:complete